MTDQCRPVSPGFTDGLPGGFKGDALGWLVPTTCPQFWSPRIVDYLENKQI
jgi:hypothetical protein